MSSQLRFWENDIPRTAYRNLPIEASCSPLYSDFYVKGRRGDLGT